MLEDFPHFADVRNKAGLCEAMLGRMEKALLHFDAALEENPSYAEAHLNRGIILNDLGRHEEAHEAFSKSSQLDTRDSRTYPSDIGNRIAMTHAQLGDLYLAVSQAEEAAKHYEAAVNVRPRLMDIRTKFAESLIDAGDLEKAKAELEIILESRPAFVGARIRLGVVLQRVGDVEGTIREWKQCTIDDPQDMRPRAYMASAGVKFPYVHRSHDEDASEADEEESDD